MSMTDKDARRARWERRVAYKEANSERRVRRGVAQRDREVR